MYVYIIVQVEKKINTILNYSNNTCLNNKNFTICYNYNTNYN